MIGPDPATGPVKERPAVAVRHAKRNVALDGNAALRRARDASCQLGRNARTGCCRRRRAGGKKKQQKCRAKSHVRLNTPTRLKRERTCLFRGALRMFMRAQARRTIWRLPTNR